MEKVDTSQPLIIKNNNISKQFSVRDTSYKGDAYNNSNFLSKLFFYWAYKIMKVNKHIFYLNLKISNNIPLKVDHLGGVEGSNRSRILLSNLNYYWEKKNYKNKKPNPLFSTVMRANCCNNYINLLISIFRQGNVHDLLETYRRISTIFICLYIS
jgi:hypothetical protein